MNKYRFINVLDLETNENINVGIMFESDNKPIFKIVDIDLYKDIFNFIDKNHLNFCIDIIKQKYENGELSFSKISISDSISISNVRVNKYDIDYIFNNYITILKLGHIIKFDKLLEIESENYYKESNENKHNKFSKISSKSLELVYDYIEFMEDEYTISIESKTGEISLCYGSKDYSASFYFTSNSEIVFTYYDGDNKISSKFRFKNPKDINRIFKLYRGFLS